MPTHEMTPPGWMLLEQRALTVIPPFRLDLTAAALRRTPANLVDVWTEGGIYLRAARTGDGPLVTTVTQAAGATELTVGLHAPETGMGARPDPLPSVPDVSVTLGTRMDLGGFYAAARGLPLLWPVVNGAWGVKPPRYPSLWEAVCNAVVFQQISLEAASTVMGRLVSGLSDPVHFGAVALRPFPGPEALLAADSAVLRGFGLSASKASSLREAAHAILSGGLTEAEIETLPTEAALARLMRERGIGRWTASVILLRGFQRLDIFPLADSGARRGLQGLLGEEYRGDDPDASSVLEALGPWRGMLYYHLLLRRLEKQGLVQFAQDSL